MVNPSAELTKELEGLLIRKSKGGRKTGHHLGRTTCGECKRKLVEEDNPKRYTLCKQCREQLYRGIETWNILYGGGK